LLVSVVYAQRCDIGCKVTNDCRNDTLCNVCRLGGCTSGGNCGDFCLTNKDCYATWCNTCQANKCKSTCSKRCVLDSDCGSPCTHCMQGTCQTAGCGSKCVQYGDCLGACKQCLQGSCALGGCGATCITNIDCMGQGNCTSCTNIPGSASRVCTSRCGMPCGSDYECFGKFSNCGQCSNGKCQLSNRCGTACVDDTGCSGHGSTCRRCNLGNRTCDAGGPCEAPCKTNNDCDYRSGCGSCVGGKCSSQLSK